MQVRNEPIKRADPENKHNVSEDIKDKPLANPKIP